MSFTTTALAGNRYLVEGTDVRGNDGQQVVDGTQWNNIAARREVRNAHAQFDEALEEFYAPLMAAAEKANKAMVVTMDPLLYIVEQEEQTGTAEREAVLTHLDPSSVILRAIETGADDRLIWVNGVLELTAATPVEDVEAEPAEVVEAEPSEPGFFDTDI